MSLLLALGGGGGGSITGTFAATLAGATLLVNGVIGHQGTFSTTLDNATLAVVGTVTTPGSGVTGTFATTLDGAYFKAWESRPGYTACVRPDPRGSYVQGMIMPVVVPIIGNTVTITFETRSVVVPFVNRRVLA